MSKSKLKSPEPPAIADDRSARYAFYVIAAMWGVGVACTLARALAPLLVLLPILAVGWVWWQRRQGQQQQQATLQRVFYQLLQDYRGQLTVLDLAMTAQVPAIVAQQFLDARAQEFAAQFGVSETGDVFYQFPLRRSQPVMIVEPLPEAASAINQTVGRQCSPAIDAAKSLTQAELARRLGVSASTLSRKKFATDLTEWSRTKDPDGLGWAYLVQTQRFLALSEKVTR